MAKAAPTVYLLFPSTAKVALEFYGQIFESEVFMHSYAEFSRTDGPRDAIAHGGLKNGPVEFYIADAGQDEAPFSQTGLMLSLLGAAEPAILRSWFEQLSKQGNIVEPLIQRP